MQSVKEKLARFIAEQFNQGENVAFDLPLLESGIVDSMGLVTVSVFIEKEFGVHIDDTYIDEDNMGTVERMARLIETLKEA